jgi:isopenicillin N synthase-like dioxygenase
VVIVAIINMTCRIPTVDLAVSDDFNVPLVREACLDMGFFQIINFGISESELLRARDIANRFFALPSDMKAQYPLTFAGGELFGYAAVGAESQMYL